MEDSTPDKQVIEAGPGRPTKFNDAIREKIASLAEKGKTVEQIAEIIGVTPRTIYNWQGKHPDLFHALKEAKQVADDLVEASLFARAVGYSHPEVKVFCDKGEITEHEVVKHYPPDVTAAIFWLKNRQPELWREKQPGEDDHTVNLKGEIEVGVKRIDIAERVKQLKGEE